MVARLKGEKPKPDIKPSKLEKGSGKNNGNDKKTKKTAGIKKKEKNRHLKIYRNLGTSIRIYWHLFGQPIDA